MHSFLYSLTICLLHYYPRHVSNINMPIFRRKNCIHAASVIFAICKRLHSTHVEDNSVTDILLMNKENCALKLVDEITLYYDARSKKHQSTVCSSCVRFVDRTFTNLNKRERKFPGLFPTRFLSVSLHTCLLCPQLSKLLGMACFSRFKYLTPSQVLLPTDTGSLVLNVPFLRANKLRGG